jgi:hypothetical protein
MISSSYNLTHLKILEAESISWAEIYRVKGAHRFGIYESNELVWYPEARRAIRRAGWDFVRKEATQK